MERNSNDTNTLSVKFLTADMDKLIDVSFVDWRTTPTGCRGLHLCFLQQKIMSKIEL